VDQSTHTEQFAAYLRMLKDRTGRGYERLGRQAGVSGSSLHRYCSGLSVPSDYRVVHAFAKTCGASHEELRSLNRLWALADAERDVADDDHIAVVADIETPDSDAVVADLLVPEAVVMDPDDTDELAGSMVHTVVAPPGVAIGQRSRHPVLVVLAVAVLLGVSLWAWDARRSDPSGASDRNGQLLFSAACEPTVSMGEHDECVREVQRLLVQAGGKLTVDGDFGPETLRRVTAFQVLAGLPPKGVVDDATKRGLYEQKVRVATWSPTEVEQRIREVFPEDPDHAVAIARCQSFLDPLWVLPNTNGTRNWGVFQISDPRLIEMGGTPLLAFDPAWNIGAARRLWSARRDFHDWPSCDAAWSITPTAP
jgi:Helix-turn-helix domain/Putative peptidoglycan binding domain